MLRISAIRQYSVTILIFCIAGFCVLSSIIPITNGALNVLCPDALKELTSNGADCSAIKCMSTLRQRECVTGSVLEENVTLCNCCPGCVKYKAKFEEECSLLEPGDGEYDPVCTARICPVIRGCRKGLVCRRDPSDGLKPKCMLPEVLPENCKGLCWLKQALAEKYNWDWQWETACTYDGYFKPVQCKGTTYRGDCYCVNQCGVRIFGRSRWDKAETQTCECSRSVYNARLKGKISSIHCSEEGNYEALQCDTDSNLCYCVDPETGKLTGEVLPEHEWKNLPCYNSTATNYDDDGRYLRRCESEWAAAKKIEIEAKLHGLTFDSPSGILVCDYDGSFGQKYTDVINNREYCAHKNGDQIGANFRTLDTVVDMDCNCARDSVYYSLNQIPFTRSCDAREPRGSYKSVYINGVNATCVDADGYSYGEQVDSQYACCLETVVNNDGNQVTTCSPANQNYCVQNSIRQCSQYNDLVRKHFISTNV